MIDGVHECKITITACRLCARVVAAVYSRLRDEAAPPSASGNTKR